MTRTSSFTTRLPRRSTRSLNQSQCISDGHNEAEISLPRRQRSNRKRSSCSSSVSKVKRSNGEAQTLTSTIGGSMMPPLLSLGTLVKGTVLKRPSSQVKSPYVADVSLDDSTIVLAHAPALDVGGMCVPGKTVYMSSRPAGGKTSHAIELVVSEAPNNDERVLVGAHPRLGELIAYEVLKRGLLKDAFSLRGGLKIGPVHDFSNDNDDQNIKHNDEQRISLKQQVTLGDSRVDFEMKIHKLNEEKPHRVVFEVKNVVCADYEKGAEPVKSGINHCVVVAESSDDAPYKRAALFPWAKSRSQTFEDKKVCSARALKHLRNLYDLSSDKEVTPVVLFIVNRSDCETVRACHEACPVFRDVLEEVTRNGAVQALGIRVRWTEGGSCYFDGLIPVKTS